MATRYSISQSELLSILLAAAFTAPLSLALQLFAGAEHSAGGIRVSWADLIDAAVWTIAALACGTLVLLLLWVEADLEPLPLEAHTITPPGPEAAAADSTEPELDRDKPPLIIRKREVQ